MTPLPLHTFPLCPPSVKRSHNVSHTSSWFSQPCISVVLMSRRMQHCGVIGRLCSYMFGCSSTVVLSHISVTWALLVEGTGDALWQEWHSIPPKALHWRLIQSIFDLCTHFTQSPCRKETRFVEVHLILNCYVIFLTFEKLFLSYVIQ